MWFLALALSVVMVAPVWAAASKPAGNPPPIPAPAPAPAPAPVPAPVLTFKVGAKVQVVGTNMLNVRTCPNLTVLGTQKLGASGVITGGTGALATGFHRWQVDFATGADGCVAQNLPSSSHDVLTGRIYRLPRTPHRAKRGVRSHEPRAGHPFGYHSPETPGLRCGRWQRESATATDRVA
jgi:hypothetical protein